MFSSGRISSLGIWVYLDMGEAYVTKLVNGFKIADILYVVCTQSLS